MRYFHDFHTEGSDTKVYRSLPKFTTAMMESTNRHKLRPSTHTQQGFQQSLGAAPHSGGRRRPWQRAAKRRFPKKFPRGKIPCPPATSCRGSSSCPFRPGRQYIKKFVAATPPTGTNGALIMAAAGRVVRSHKEADPIEHTIQGFIRGRDPAPRGCGLSFVAGGVPGYLFAATDLASHGITLVAPRPPPPWDYSAPPRLHCCLVCLGYKLH
ncbi:hypothetical protein E2C01_102001 [Portunus trituberculatus]|uniref:Uncharacterized protein n=1 Tax=Portunus trituberculatus TaxID=210409 RepID=A0A5B7KHE9_PORTR|nr:hypothetical protein [Portunus trituberculatus]